MRTSRSVGYGLLAACYIAQHQKDGIVLSQGIADKHEIPLEYLLKIMQSLVKANILRSKRGPRGGFKFAQPIDKITIQEIVEAIEGPSQIDLGLSEISKAGKIGKDLQATFDEAVSAQSKVLSGVKLSSFIPAESVKTTRTKKSKTKTKSKKR